MNKEKTKTYKAYKEMASDYYNYVDTKPWNAYLERPNSMQLMGEVKDQTILDAGCAAGWFCKTFLDKGAKMVIGIDYNKEMIDYAKMRLANYPASSYLFFVHNLEEPIKTIEDESIDKIINSLAIHYIKDLSKPLSEFNRVLKKGGELVISTDHPTADYNFFKRKDYYQTELVTDEWEMNGKNIEVEYYTRPLGELINPIIKAGFMITEILEGKPTQEFKDLDAKNYEYLMKHPHFIFIKAKKI